MTPERLESIRSNLSRPRLDNGRCPIEHCDHPECMAEELLVAVDDLDAGVWADEIADLKADLGNSESAIRALTDELVALRVHVEQVRKFLEETEPGGHG